MGIKKIEKATHIGKINIGDLEISCAVLEKGRRVLSQGSLAKTFKYTAGGYQLRKRAALNQGGELPLFLVSDNLIPFISNDLRSMVANTVTYKSPHGGSPAIGVDAGVLPKICDVWLKARAAGVLLKSQEKTADRAEILMRALAHVAIIALVDEATGFQTLRHPEALRFLVAQYIEEEKREWQKEFPNEFYVNLNKIYNRNPKNLQHRPKYFAKFTNKYIYYPMEQGEVLKELDRLNPIDPAKGTRKDRLHQHLSKDYGRIKLKNQIREVNLLLRLAPNPRRFKNLFARAFPVSGSQVEMDIGNDGEE